MKASVCMTAYNLQRFIAQAIESVMMQQTDFDYELVIGEDCSTDGTREICLKYRDKYPDRIRLLLREKNLGLTRNFADTFSNCTGQYLAVLDGDDYWTTPHKLQKQVDFLDAHPDYAICFARTVEFFEDGSREPSYMPTPEDTKAMYTVEDLLQGDMIANSSVMYRGGLVTGFPDWLFCLEAIDWPLHVLVAQHGKVGYLDDVMAAYRIHANSGFSSRPLTWQVLASANMYRAMSIHLGLQPRNVTNERLAWFYQRLAVLHFQDGDKTSALRYAIRSINTYPRRLTPRVLKNAIVMIRRKK
jgi:glycosyltransferase involved in cell wall biosynthesis